MGIALGCGALGQDTRTQHPSWCWIRSDVPQFAFQVFCAKGWELLAYACVLVFYGLIVVYLTKKVGQGLCTKGPAISHREAGGGGLQNGKIAGPKLFAPCPLDTVQTFCTSLHPPFKEMETVCNCL